MTAVVPPLTVALPAGRPTLARLSAVELRKTVDTRAGAWIVGLIAAASVAVVVLALVVGDGDGDGRSWPGLVQLTLVPAAVALPVLGILTATGEWSQRTALTTFALVPDRRRVVAAKLVATGAWGVLSLAWSLVLGVLGAATARLLDRGPRHGAWSLSPTLVATAALLMALLVVMGLAVGLLLQSTPAAIAAYFVVPTAWTITGEVVARLDAVARWLDLNRATGPLGTDGPITAEQWLQLATSSALWIALPLALGTVRTLRREVS